jgi:hypothetical protein
MKAGLSIQYTVALFSHLVSDMVSSTVYVSLVNVRIVMARLRSFTGYTPSFDLLSFTDFLRNPKIP